MMPPSTQGRAALYQSPADQAWLRLWVSIYGPDSKLASYLSGEGTNHVRALKNFFADRDLDGNATRRKAIIHLRLGHDRHMNDGRIIQVGEHLSGERFFTWRGYNITVGVPGIHYPAPESLSDPLLIVGDPDVPLPPNAPPEEDWATMKYVGNVTAASIWTPRRVPFRRGEPTVRYADSSLPQFPSKRPPS